MDVYLYMWTSVINVFILLPLTLLSNTRRFLGGQEMCIHIDNVRIRTAQFRERVTHRKLLMCSISVGTLALGEPEGQAHDGYSPSMQCIAVSVDLCFQQTITPPPPKMNNKIPGVGFRCNGHQQITPEDEKQDAKYLLFLNSWNKHNFDVHVTNITHARNA